MAQIEIPGYAIYEQLGRGGMATVYRALHLNLDREVAIKVIDTARIADESFSERFVREARISARLSHPHILQIYDVNVFGSLNYISMELLHGGDLGDLIRGPTTQRTIYTMMQQMTAALDYAAAKGYVHRDIKPGNIMLRGPDNFVLADFGIARASDSSTRMTQAGLLVGTPSYMSPEQAEGGDLDGRSDLYSLAVVCYEMLTKEVPYEADSAVSVAVKHLTEKVPRLPAHLTAYQPFLDRALAKKPDDRFQSGQEMYAAFCEVRHLFDDEDVLTSPRAVRDRPTPPLSTDTGGDATVLWDHSSDTGSGRASGTYRLTPTHQADGLLSGIRNEPRHGQKAASRAHWPRAAAALAAVVLLGAGAAGGYLWWQGQQSPAATAGDAMADTGDPALDALLGQAGTAIAEGDFDRARTLLVDARDSNPQHPTIARLEGELAAAQRAGELVQRAEEVQRVSAQHVEVLLDEGRALLEQGELAAAGGKFATALELSPEQAEARQLAEDTVAALVDRAEQALSAAEFARAGEDLASALALAPARQDLSERLAALPELEAQWQWQQQLAKANQQLAGKQFAAAADAFGALLAGEPADAATAQAGLQDSVDGLVEQARGELQQQRFERARSHLDKARQWLPEDPALAELTTELATLEKAWRAEQAAIAQREADASARANAALRAMGEGDLQSARHGYEQLQQEYPNLGITQELRQRLLDAYAEAVRDEMEVKSWTTALDLIAEGQVLAPELPLWASLREEVDHLESSDRRRLGAY